MSVKKVLLGLMIASGLTACRPGSDEQNHQILNNMRNSQKELFNQISNHEIGYTESASGLVFPDDKNVNITNRAEYLNIHVSTVYDLDDSTLIMKEAYSRTNPEVVPYKNFSKQQKDQFVRAYNSARPPKL